MSLSYCVVILQARHQFYTGKTPTQAFQL